MYFNTFALLKIIGIFENSNLPKTTQFRIDIGRFKEKTFLYKQVSSNGMTTQPTMTNNAKNDI